MSDAAEKSERRYMNSNGVLGNSRMKPTKLRLKSTPHPHLVTAPGVRRSGAIQRSDQSVESFRKPQRPRKKNSFYATEIRSSSSTTVHCLSCSITRTSTARPRSHFDGLKRASSFPYKDHIPEVKTSSNPAYIESSLLPERPGAEIWRSLGSNSLKQMKNQDITSPINAVADADVRISHHEAVFRTLPDLVGLVSSRTVASVKVPLLTSDVSRSGGSATESQSVKDDMPSEAVIGMAVGCVLVFWLIIGPVVCLLLRKSFHSQTFFQRQDTRTFTSGKGPILMEEVEIPAMEKARLYRPDYPVGSLHTGRFPAIYAPLPQTSLSPSHHHQHIHHHQDSVQVLTIPCSYDRHLDTLPASYFTDNSRENPASTHCESVSNDSTTITYGDGYCLCNGADRFCCSTRISTSPLNSSSSIFPDGSHWQMQRVPGHLTDPNSDPSSTGEFGCNTRFRKVPKMGQTCLRSSYAARSRGSQPEGGVPDWSSMGHGRPRPEGRARSEDRVEDEVLVNRCVRTPVGYRRLPRTGSASPRCRSKRTPYLDST